ncbi:transporter substrate-binding domain-containing protein [Mangrovimicrobium sediminis]|uniref:Transporter substrate-binding domain-containing protein n=1 Tax=Mangrovimicrobium sediminis TaxID=2562682 RepID=A0A4Z0LVU3_9GAMM|nr:HD domain-containing phosphohydrolase [Haliea sp. SAOS-164]TGD71185.1 transporter substrate-binding domain-containing protein [Haliea sp. SAOS-164]
MNITRPRTTIRLTVVTVFLLATLLTAAIAIGLQYHYSQALGREAAGELYAATVESIATETAGIRQVNVNLLELLARSRDLADPAAQDATLDTFIQVLRNNPLLYGIYVGRADGSFHEVINLDAGDAIRSRLLALPEDRWVVIRVSDTGNGRRRAYQYLDAQLKERASRDEATDFDVTQRPWYRQAIDSGKTEATAPYLFEQSGEPGRTIARRLVGGDAVVGVDMTLRTMSGFLNERQASRDSTLYLYTDEGVVIASSERDASATSYIPLPELSLSREDRAYLESLGPLTVSNELDWPPFDYTQGGEPRGYSVDVMRLIARLLGLQLRFVNGYNWQELVGQFEQGNIDLLQSVILTEQNAALGLPGRAYTTLPFAVLTRPGPGTLGELAQLSGARLAIPAGWSVIPMIRETYPGITIVETRSTREAIEKVLNGKAYAALDNEIILRYIVEHYFIDGVDIHTDLALGFDDPPQQLHVLVPPRLERLRKLLDRAIAAIGPAQQQALAERWLDFEARQRSARSEVVPSDQLVAIARDPSRWGSLVPTVIDGEEYLVYATKTDHDDATSTFVGILTPTRAVMAPYMHKVKIGILATAGFLLVLLPLSWFFANPIVRPVRQLADENDKIRRREFEQVQRVRSHVKELDELSESMVRMVTSIREYEASQRELMDAFIRLIAQAIDDKSAYTGGHCERVPELALMLAHAASDSQAPPFDSFRLEGEDAWREYRIAAWLHDCGKITTPEHIVDKGSKLETIYNRIHEVRMRFEVLARDAEISYWERLHQHPEQQAQLLVELQATQQALQEEFRFVAECNVGGEFLDDAARERLLAIAARTWQRRFSDRLGLSPVEELRLRGDEPALPVTEPLLADRPEHIIERERPAQYPPEYGIDMDIPEHLYNLGELYNLSISRGTLTAEDRFKINEHMISTIKMLESLPFPEGLKNVPRYASTHHETMRGSGYPRKLSGEQLSIPERILAVADVFEALTAADRPYKKAKPVSVAIDILHRMVEDRHIDRDCFELFLRSGVYRQYASTYLQPAQVDEVDISKYLEGAA